MTAHDLSFDYPWVQPDHSSDAAFYRPYDKGVFRMEPGLAPFGKDFGNGAKDAHVFQIDAHWPTYRRSKLLARRENFSKYVVTKNFNDATQTAVTRFMLARLLHEHPHHFSWSDLDSGAGELHCHLSGETLSFDSLGHLVANENNPKDSAPYISAFDALVCQTQEDVAVMTLGAHADTAVAIHLCFPNHWDAREKIGTSFVRIHEPVADIGKITANAAKILATCVQNTHGFVRFAWGVATDSRLNHHPEPPHRFDINSWHGRSFDIAEPRLFVRIERQTLWGLPEVNSCVFTIRTSFQDVTQLAMTDLKNVAAALNSMSPDVRIYKGLAKTHDTVIAWLNSLTEKR